MHTLTAPQRPDRPAEDAIPLSHSLSDLTPRTSLPDRVALRLALALLLWSTRPQPIAPPEVFRRHRERVERERDWQLRCHRLPLL